MATDLTNVAIKDGFSNLLHLDGGATATEKILYDGDGTATVLKIGTASASVTSTPSLANHVANKTYVDTQISGLSSTYHPLGGSSSQDLVARDITVHRTFLTKDSQNVQLGDAIITLNAEETGTPTENAGFEVERGTSTNTALRWNETSDRWEFTNDGSTYYNIPISTEYNNNTYQSSDFNHDDLSGVTANEHIDWTSAGAGTIDSSNYTDTTYSVMGSGNSYASGLVPSGSATHGDTYLRKDGSWGTPIDTNTQLSDSDISGMGYIKSYTDTVDMGDGFRLVDIDSNVAVTENEYVKIKTSNSGSHGFGAITGTGTSIDPYILTLNTPNTTYTSSSFDHDSLTNTHNLTTDIDHDALTGFVADEHIDWTTDQGSTNIHSGNYTDTSQATEFYIRDSVPTTYTIGHGKYIKFTSSGSNSPAQPTLSGSGTDASPYTLLTQYRTYATATTSSGGLMSSGDKTKLDGIETGATADQDLSGYLTKTSPSLTASTTMVMNGAKISANDSASATPTTQTVGTAGQVLTSYGSGGGVYWSTLSSATTLTLWDGDTTNSGQAGAINIADKHIKFVEGSNIDINYTGSGTGAFDDPYNLTFAVTGLSYLPLSGGTLTGSLTGTSATFSESGGNNATLEVNRGLDGGRIQFSYSGNSTGLGEIGQTYYGTGRTRIWMGANLESFSTGHLGPTRQDTNYSAWWSTWNSKDDEFTVTRNGTNQLTINSSSATFSSRVTASNSGAGVSTITATNNNVATDAGMKSLAGTFGKVRLGDSINITGACIGSSGANSGIDFIVHGGSWVSAMTINSDKSVDFKDNATFAGNVTSNSSTFWHLSSGHIIRGGTFSSSINNTSTALKIFPATTTPRTANYYNSGIGFFHLDPANWGSSYTGMHAWIGLKLKDTPAQERSHFVIATTDNTTNPSYPIERMRIESDGNATFSGTLYAQGGGSATNRLEFIADTIKSIGSNMVFATDGGTSLTLTRNDNNATFAGSITSAPSSGDAELVLQSSTQTLRLDQNSIRTMTNTSIGINVNNDWNKSIYLNTSGYFGVNTTNPQNIVDIKSTSTASYPLRIRGNIDNNGGYTGIIFGYESDTTAYSKAGIMVEGTSGNVQPNMYFLINQGANSDSVTKSDAKLAIINSSGDVHAKNDIVAFSSTLSDVRLKEEITPITNALDVINQIDTIRYKYNYRDGYHYGIKAQQLQELIPEIVKETDLSFHTKKDGEDKKLTVRDKELIPFLIEAIKEQQKQILELKKQTGEA